MARTDADVADCQRLRHQFFGGTGGIDADAFDALSQHVMVEQDGQLVCTLRLRVFPVGGNDIDTYTGGFYRFGPFDGPALEIGRFCIGHTMQPAHVLRLAWAAITRAVDNNRISDLFGCASFAGIDPTAYADAFGLLVRQPHSNVNVTSQHIDKMMLSDLAHGNPDMKKATGQLPPLLRSYLGMGGYVSDECVVDHALGTVLVFAGLRIADIPAARAKSLRAIADQTQGLHMDAAHNS